MSMKKMISLLTMLMKKNKMRTRKTRQAASRRGKKRKRKKSGRTAEAKLKQSLLGDGEGPQLEDITAEEGLPEDFDMLCDDDVMADFIVDEEEVGENEAPARRRKPYKKRSRQTMEEEFDPVLLPEKYMTDRNDIPERVLLSEESTGSPPIDDMLLEEESNWIHNQLVNGTSLLSVASHGETELSINKDDIRRFLEFTHVQKLDVPFIAAYRKEGCLSLLTSSEQHEDYKNKVRVRWHKILWAIQDLDRKWLLL